MPTKVLRLDSHLIDQAKRIAKVENRSIPQQVERWAKIGQKAESKARVQAVLDGTLDYDLLDEGDESEIFQWVILAKPVGDYYDSLKQKLKAVGVDSDGL